MDHRYCMKCECVYSSEEISLCCGSESHLIDWDEFAFIMGYPLYPVKKRYDIFHFDLEKRKDAEFGFRMREYSSEEFYREFNHWKEIEQKKIDFK
ncbi:aldehyde dehydrogenase [Bacillus sp. FSL R9-9410]|uniref:aldehyde dehydrogenase n=1 Tax=Bacillus sp. FSL R9-9410 TaxID=2921590 RepID=UPI003101462B